MTMTVACARNRVLHEEAILFPYYKRCAVTKTECFRLQFIDGPEGRVGLEVNVADFSRITLPFLEITYRPKTKSLYTGAGREARDPTPGHRH